MRARYYDPEIGRFISEDPIGFSGGDVNLFVYAGNNPIMFVDPSGLAKFGKRPLKGLPFMVNNPVGNDLNTELSHEQLFYDNDDNVGFFNDSKVREDESLNDGSFNKYIMGDIYYNDALMQTAVKRVNAGKYSFVGNNCQNWAEKVREEYGNLERTAIKSLNQRKFSFDRGGSAK